MVKECEFDPLCEPFSKRGRRMTFIYKCAKCKNTIEADYPKRNGSPANRSVCYNCVKKVRSCWWWRHGSENTGDGRFKNLHSTKEARVMMELHAAIHWLNKEIKNEEKNRKT